MQDQINVNWQNGATFPGAQGGTFTAIVHSTADISIEGDVHKPKFEIQLGLSDADESNVAHFEAGDSFYVVCPNNEVDIEFLLTRSESFLFI